MRVYRESAGFSLIELMIVVAIIGVLAVTAMPRYQDYSTRARLTEAVQLLAAARVSVAEYAIAKGQMPANQVEAGIEDVASDLVASISYTLNSNGDGLLTARLRGTGNPEVDERHFSMEGKRMNGVISWHCRTGGAAGQAAIPVRLLPANCRSLAGPAK